MFLATRQLTPQNIRRAYGVQVESLLDFLRLVLANLYAEPLSNFGADAVERWCTEQEIEEMVPFANRLAV